MLKWINIAKGLGILFIVFGHSRPPGIIFESFYYFSIPLFFFISGYLFLKNQPSFLLFIRKKIDAYIVPYYLYGTVFTLLMLGLLFVQESLNIDTILILSQGLLLGQIDYMAHTDMWFLQALFITSIMAYILFCIMKIHQSFIKTIMIIVLLLFLIYDFNGLRNYYFSITTTPTALLFFILGFMYHKYEDIDSYFSLRYLIPVTLVLYYFSFYPYRAALDVGHSIMKPSMILMLLNACLGIMNTVLISKMLRDNKFLEYIGSISLYIFMFHQIFIPFINPLYSIFDYDNAWMTIWIFVGILKVLFSIVLYEVVIKPLKKLQIGKYL